MTPTPPPAFLELRDLRLLRAIADSGSLTAACAQLFITQSTGSYRVAELQRRVRAPLIIRRGRRAELTATATALLTAGRGLLREAETLEHWLAERTDEVRRTIRVAAECYTTYPWLPAAARRLRTQFPEHLVVPTPEWTSEPLEGLRADALDVAIVTSTADTRALAVHPLWRDEMVAVMAVDHRLAQRPYVRPQDLQTEHLVLYDDDPATSWVLSGLLARVGVRPASTTAIPLTEGILALCEATDAVTVLAPWAAARATQSGALTSVRLRSRFAIRQWHAVHRPVDDRRSPITALVRALARAPRSTDAA